MNEKESIKVFDAKTEQEKLEVCQTLNSFVTYNGISKGYIVHVFKWLYSVTVDEISKGMEKRRMKKYEVGSS